MANAQHVQFAALPGLYCNRCKHIWVPESFKKYKKNLDYSDTGIDYNLIETRVLSGKIKLPKVCPHCKSKYWNKDRERLIK
jgi:hypothetical protein